jgi:hypothetical protein
VDQPEAEEVLLAKTFWFDVWNPRMPVQYCIESRLVIFRLTNQIDDIIMNLYCTVCIVSAYSTHIYDYVYCLRTSPKITLPHFSHFVSPK